VRLELRSSLLMQMRDLLAIAKFVVRYCIQMRLLSQFQRCRPTHMQLEAESMRHFCLCYSKKTFCLARTSLDSLSFSQSSRLFVSDFDLLTTTVVFATRTINPSAAVRTSNLGTFPLPLATPYQINVRHIEVPEVKQTFTFISCLKEVFSAQSN